MLRDHSAYPPYSPPTAELTRFFSSDILLDSPDDIEDDPGNW